MSVCGIPGGDRLGVRPADVTLASCVAASVFPLMSARSSWFSRPHIS
jgi:hypothetical protein